MLSSWALWVMTIFVIAVLYGLTRGGMLLIRNLREEPRIGDCTDFDWPDPPAHVTVIIPARDEEEHIQRSVESVLASDYPHLNLIVVDDRSTDGTPEIVKRLAQEDSRITVVSVERLPEDWTGKTHALYHGAIKAIGSILLFVDADTIISSDAISRSLAFFLERKLGMLSLLPGFIERGFFENTLHPHLAMGISMFNPLTEVNDQTKKAALASGSFLMMTRQTYDSVGTWKQFKNEITEDIAMARAVKDGGWGLIVARTNDMALTRQFGTISDLLRFWKRTYYGGLDKNVPRITQLLINFVSLSLLSVFMVYSAVLWALGTGGLPSAILFFVSALALLVLVAPLGIFMQKECGNWAYSLASPMSLPVSAWVVFKTLMAVLRGKGIQWRGSTYK